jgi:hypothetical protein
VEPIILPVRFELRAGLDGPACGFTAHLPFSVSPQPAHKILFDAVGQQGVTILTVYHFLPDKSSDEEPPTCLVVTAPLVLDSYDQMLKVMDWFKALYQVEDFQADRDQPEPYYSFYRSLVHVLDVKDQPQPLVAYDPTSIKIFAECCRAVVLAEYNPGQEEFQQATLGFNVLIERLHKVVLDHKSQEPDGADMLTVIKEWEAFLNPKKTLTWQAPIDRCIAFAVLLFSKLRSIPADRLPKTIGDQR